VDDGEVNYFCPGTLPVDILVDHDTDMNLCGLPIRVLRLAGHTYGSMGSCFEMAGRRYVTIGDLIMPDGPLGYSGSVNFSPQDVLASLKKLDSLGPRRELRRGSYAQSAGVRDR
jgi:glyoxylase-like metal-dependent hydrolase (beta-lactamase superfamily II)